MIVNGESLLRKAPIRHMVPAKRRHGGVSHGLGEAGYDIRVRQTVLFKPGLVLPEHKDRPWISGTAETKWRTMENKQLGVFSPGNFILASTVEEFDMPNDLVGIVHDKSTWARRGLSVFNTVIEPGWKGFLTLELVYHGQVDLTIPAGAGIAQIVFHQTTDRAAYAGRYQNQSNEPVAAIDWTEETP